MPHKLKYLAFGWLSNAALGLYWAAPRPAMQEELIRVHRWALKKAHDARKQDPHEKSMCLHVNALQWHEVEWCPRCGAIHPVDAVDIRSGVWTSPGENAALWMRSEKADDEPWIQNPEVQS